MKLKLENSPIAFNENQLALFLQTIAADYKKNISTLLFTFLNRVDMLQKNQSYLGHDTHTDVITFDYSNETTLEAEVYISIPQATENAKKLQQNTENEFLRLIVHAVLHCVGFKDKTKDERSIMRKKEDYYLSMFHVKQHTAHV